MHSSTPIHARSILFVDDEEKSCKWFARMFEDEFTVLTALNVDEALEVLNTHRSDIAVLITDYSMPGRTGLDLLQIVQRDYRNVIRILTSAYADKDVIIAAINQGQVYRVLEKPMDCQETRLVLRSALALCNTQAVERALHDSRAEAMRETLGFLSHEINTPLTTLRGHISNLIERYQSVPTPDGITSCAAQFPERRPGTVLSALQACERAALYCQSLVSTFVQSARDAHPGPAKNPITASGLVKELLDEFPFEGDERACVSCSVTADFELPGQRDLLYLVFCTLTKNALLAMKNTPEPCLQIVLGTMPQPGGGPLVPSIQFVDNGPGIAPEVLPKLSKEPYTSRAESGGSGMGLVFCRRLMLLLGGSIEISSVHGAGATVSLCFPSLHSAG